jgi:glycosyltransferase involved in cell wall biosynthesis
VEFNFAEAINQGLQYISSDYVLIISSHTLLHNQTAIEYAIELLSADEYLGACYFSNENNGELKHIVIDKNKFDGFNGLWNTCSLVRYSLLRKRKFRSDVFIAEDQEWARWLFESQGKAVARINGAGMDNTPNERIRKNLLARRKNEYVAIAYFANRDLMRATNLARIASRIFKPTTGPIEERYFNITLLISLLLCFLRKPRYKSIPRFYH